MTSFRLALLLLVTALTVAPAAISQPLYSDSSQTALPATMLENGMDVESADIDRDGDLDIIIANEFQANVILVNDGTGHYKNESTARLPQPRHDSEDVAVGDFDGDGDPDIIFVSEDDIVHEYYLNNGSGVFTAATYKLPNSESNAITAGELTGDGRLDLVIGNAGQDYILVNDGEGGFIDETSTRLPSDGTITQDVELVDIDRDGDLDLIQGNEDGNRLFLNNGSGVFADETETRLPLLADMETRKVTPADVNGDGYVDLFFANVAFIPGKDLRDRIYLNDGRGFFTDLSDALLPADAEFTLDGKFADLDLDNDLDLVVSYFQNRGVKVFLNDGAGSFTDETGSVLPGPIAGDGLGIELADLNGDGYIDLYICNRGQRDKLLFHVGRTAGVDGTRGSAEPEGFGNLEVSPNPATADVVVAFDLRGAALVEIRLHDATGCAVRNLAAGRLTAGSHRFRFERANLPAGIYHLDLTIDGRQVSRRVVLL